MQLSKKDKKRGKDIRITKINYKYFGEKGYLSAIQLEYSDGNKSPLFENPIGSRAIQKDVQVSSNAGIRYIGMA